MEIEFKSHQYCLYHLEHYFCYLMENVALDNVQRERVRLCFYEVVTNAVVHGNRYDENKKVWIQIEIIQDKFILTIRDEGNGFDMESIPDPILSENLEKTSGRGVFFVKGNCEKYEYCQHENKLKMEWRI